MATTLPLSEPFPVGAHVTIRPPYPLSGVIAKVLGPNSYGVLCYEVQPDGTDDPEDLVYIEQVQVERAYLGGAGE